MKALGVGRSNSSSHSPRGMNRQIHATLDTSNGGKNYLRGQVRNGASLTRRIGPYLALQYRPRATLYFRNEEEGNVARIHGQASFFPLALGEYLVSNVPSVYEIGNWNYRIGPEHADRVISIMTGGL